MKRDEASAMLVESWPCTYWTREDQISAICEGWSLTIAGPIQDLIGRETIVKFNSHDEAIAYVTERAQEGSELHARALVLHISAVLHGKSR